MAADHPAGRIRSVDGLRAVAVLGVIWVHSWTYAGNPALRLRLGGGWGFDLERLLAPLGNGVDFFFVISGFCICLSLQRVDWSKPARSYFQFIARRWRRLAPAYYAAVVACALGWAWALGHFPVRAFAADLAWAPSRAPFALAPPFWSLQTEWEFYLAFPIVLLACGRKRLTAAVLIIAGLSLLHRLDYFTRPREFSWDPMLHLAGRWIEFGWGVLAADLAGKGHALVGRVRGGRGVLVGIAVAYLGRILMTTEAAAFFAPLTPAVKALAEPVMTAGFAVIVLSVATSPSGFERFLTRRPLQAIGRWSYSLYLWHWWPCVWAGLWWRHRLGATVPAHYLALATGFALALPVAWLSYTFLEARYPHAPPGPEAASRRASATRSARSTRFS